VRHPDNGTKPKGEHAMTEPTTSHNEIETTYPETSQTLDALIRAGARRMLIAALEAEVEAYIEQHAHLRDENGHALVVRNGKARKRMIHCGVGSLRIRAPRVHDKVPDQHFTSAILPPYLRRAPQLESALPVLYLRGLSTGDFRPALAALLGEEAVTGFSATTITRLLTVWADGLHFNVRLEDDRLACLVVIGVTPDGRKEVVALEDGYRESTESWLTLLRDLKHRGMPAPKLAVADGALGFWQAMRQVYPKTEEQRCWVHKIANVLDKLPKRMQPRAKAQLHEIMRAPDLQTALEEIGRFIAEFEDRYQKAVHTLVKDQEKLLTLFHYPAAHWIHLRTTNAIESTFATVKARTRTTKGAGSRQAGLAMAFKLLLVAGEHWRRVNSPHLVALVQAGVKFPDGKTRILPDAPERANQAVLKVQEDAAKSTSIHNI
jgi:transposase-like protein